MLKKIVFTMALSVPIIASADSYDQIYYHTYLGSSKLQKVDDSPVKLASSRNAYMPGFAVGYKFNDFFRGEIGANYRFNQYLSYYNSDLARGYKIKVAVGTLYANMLVNIANINHFVPYVGVGIGGARTAGKIKLAKGTPFTSRPPIKKSYNFYSKLVAGFHYDVNNQLAFDIQYNHSKFGKLAKKPAANILGREILAGILFKV